MSKTLQISIADACIAIEDDDPQNSWEDAPAYRPFVRSGATDISLRLHQGIPDTPAGEAVFDCPPIWTLYRQDGTSILKIFPDLFDQERTLVLPPQLEKADLYFSDQAGRFHDPFYGPAMELLLINYLARGRGSILHACGIAMNGSGILFVGESGAGKSTLAQLWNQEKGVEVLSDDRTIVRQKDEQFLMYGTPWHGEAKFGSPRGVRLERIFFLRHGPSNSIRKLSAPESVSQMLQCSFPPFWDANGMQFSLKFFSELAAGVACQELTFTPDRRVFEFIK